MYRWLLSLPFALGFVLYTYKTLSFQETKSVQTTYGPVVGEQVNTDTVSFMAFRGIPYAKEPTGELRFRAPEPPDKWDTTKQATKFGDICPQAGKAPGTTHDELERKILLFVRNAPNLAKVAMQRFWQSENCLTLNIYTLQLDEVGLRPVLVWFYGGGFFSGDGTDVLYGPEYLVKEDIVVVTANYRLGPLGMRSATLTFGFLCTAHSYTWTLPCITVFFGDRAIIHYVHAAQKWFARYTGNNNPAFFYYFTYDGEWNLVKDLYSIDLPGVTHWDELIYVFKQKVKPLAPISPNSPGYLTHKRMISFITNFVKHGTPTPYESDLYIPWKPANSTDHNTMIISADLEIQKDLLKERMDFWNDLYRTYIGDFYYQ